MKGYLIQLLLHQTLTYCDVLRQKCRAMVMSVCVLYLYVCVSVHMLPLPKFDGFACKLLYQNHSLKIYMLNILANTITIQWHTLLILESLLIILTVNF